MADSSEISRRTPFPLTISNGSSSTPVNECSGAAVGGVCLPINCQNGGSGTWAWLAAALLFFARRRRLLRA
jgi:uncharacterized protein (TIGR03382 family)